MVKSIFKKAFEILKRKPVEICGFSIVYSLILGAGYSILMLPALIIAIICAATGAFVSYYIPYRMYIGEDIFSYAMILPIFAVFVVLAIAESLEAVFKAGLYKMYINYAVENEKAGIIDLFSGFKNFRHVFGGVWWETLWLFLWGIIPIAGPVLALIKAYSYKFNTLILIDRPEVGIHESLEMSISETNGKKGSMLLCDLIVMLALFCAALVSAAGAAIPFLGVMLAFPFGAVLLVCVIAGKVFADIITVSFYLGREMPDKKEHTLYDDIKDNYFVNCKSCDNIEIKENN